MAEVYAINRHNGCAILDDDEIIRFEKMLDADGNETDDASEGAFAVAKLPDGGWVMIDFSLYAPVPTQ